MSKKIKKQKGFSLVELMISVALGGALSIVISKLTVDQAKLQKNAVANMDVNATYNEIVQIINHQISCQETFKCSSLEPGGSTQLNQIKRVSNRDSNFGGGINDPVTRYTINQQIGSIKIKNMTLSRGTGELRQNLTLQVEFEKMGEKQNLGAKVITKEFHFRASFAKDNNNVISSCNPMEGNVDACEITRSHCLNQRDLYNIRLSNGHAVVNDSAHIAAENTIVDICNNTHKQKRIWSSHGNSGTVGDVSPSTIMSNDLSSVTYIITGGGGGGGASNEFYSGQAGEHGEIKVIKVPAFPRGFCKAYIGQGGSGGTVDNPHGQDGEDSYLTCKSKTYVARGGKGGRGASLDQDQGESSADYSPYSPSYSFKTKLINAYFGDPNSPSGMPQAGGGEGGNTGYTQSQFYDEVGLPAEHGQHGHGDGGAGGGAARGVNDETGEKGFNGGNGRYGKIRQYYSEYTLQEIASDDGCLGLSSSQTLGELECEL